MKKIALINSVCGYGSTGNIVIDLCNKIDKSNMQGHIFYGFHKTNYKSATKFSSDIYVKLNILKTRLFGKHSFYSKFATKKLIRLLKEYNPDLIHINQVHGHYLNIPILFNYIEKENIPIVWTMHDCWPITGHCAHFEYINCEKWKKGCYDCPQLLSYPVSLIFDRSKVNWKDKNKYFNKPNNMNIICPSEWLASIIKQSFLNSYPIKTINNGIDLTIYKPVNIDKLRKEFGLEDEFIVLGTRGKWFDPINKKHTLELISKMPDDIRIVLLGVKKSEINNLPNNLIGVPYTSDKKLLSKYFSLADVFINLTLEDTFPTINIESLACGTPIVTFDSGGSPEIIDKKTGVVVDKGNFEKVLSAINKIKNSDVNYKTNCRERAEKLYRNTECYNKYIRLYTELMSNSSK